MIYPLYHIQGIFDYSGVELYKQHIVQGIAMVGTAKKDMTRFSLSPSFQNCVNLFGEVKSVSKLRHQ